MLALTGAGRALWAVSSPAELWQTGYGRALLAKTALLACLVGLGYLNRRRIGAFDADPPPRARSRSACSRC